MTFTSATEFLEFVSPTKGNFRAGDWVFRGHSNASWSVLPSLFRRKKEPVVEKGYNLVFERTNSSTEGRIWSSLENSASHFESQITRHIEGTLLREFADRSNRIGLPVPEIERILNKSREQLPYFPQYVTMDQPSYKEFLRVTKYCDYLGEERFWPGLYVGLAQHHGIPTKLLD